MRFDATSFVYDLFNGTELLLRMPAELLLDILAATPASEHPHIRNKLAEAQAEHLRRTAPNADSVDIPRTV